MDLVLYDSISIVGKDSGAHPSINKSLQYVDSTSTVCGVMWNPGCGFKTSAPFAVRGCASFGALSIIASIFEKC